MQAEHTPAGDGAMTDAEHLAVSLAGQLYTHIADHVVAHGTTRDADLAELAGHVHAIQHMLRGQAAARLYPHRYRLLGQTPPAGWQTAREAS